MIKFDGYTANGIKSVSIDDGLILRAILGVAKQEESPYIGQYALDELKGGSVSSAVETLAQWYAEEVMDCDAPYVAKKDGQTIFEAEADKDYIPHVMTFDELNHFKPHHDRILVFTQKSNDEDMRGTMEYGYQRIYYDDEYADSVYAYIRYPYFGRALAECMESAYCRSRIKRLELPESHPVELSDWQVFEELKTGNRIAAMVKPGDVNSAFLNVTELPYMRGKHPEHGHVLIVGAARSGSMAAIVTYARACGVELEKPKEPEVFDEIPF
jgi:hypothetical protein|nr:MAG TPA: hypothetical protein [Caudoviricetes sp.]